METKNNSYLAIGGIVVVLLVAAFGIFKYVKKDAPVGTPITTSPEATSSPVVNVDVNVTPVLRKNEYLDGTYSSTGNYFSPGGAESVKVELTIKDDVITAATVTSLAFRPESKNFQGIFIANYKSLVVGKKIEDVNLTKVSGSSLTPKGFMDALAEIKAEAKA